MRIFVSVELQLRFICSNAKSTVVIVSPCKAFYHASKEKSFFMYVPSNTAPYLCHLLVLPLFLFRSKKILQLVLLYSQINPKDLFLSCAFHLFQQCGTENISEQRSCCFFQHNPFRSYGKDTKRYHVLLPDNCICLCERERGFLHI